MALAPADCRSSVTIHARTQGQSVVSYWPFAWQCFAHTLCAASSRACASDSNETPLPLYRSPPYCAFVSQIQRFLHAQQPWRSVMNTGSKIAKRFVRVVQGGTVPSSTQGFSIHNTFIIHNKVDAVLCRPLEMPSIGPSTIPIDTHEVLCRCRHRPRSIAPTPAGGFHRWVLGHDQRQPTIVPANVIPSKRGAVEDVPEADCPSRATELSFPSLRRCSTVVQNSTSLDPQSLVHSIM